MNRIRSLAVLTLTSAIVLLVACSQAAAPAAPKAAEPAPKAAEKVVPKAEEKTEAKVAPKEEAKPVAKQPEKVEAKPAAKDLPSTIGIGTHPVGGGWHAIGTGVAKVVSDRSPIKVIVKPFAGPNAWMPMFESGELELGVASAPDVGWAYLSGPGFPKPSKTVRLIARGNQTIIVGLIVRNDSSIKSLKDLKGKRVAAEYGGNAILHLHATAYLESVGLTWSDVRPVPVADYASGLRALREGQADAVFGGSPSTGTTLETDAAIGVRAFDFGDVPPDQADKASAEVLKSLRKHLPGADLVRIKKQGFLKTDATLYQYPSYLLASSKLGDNAAYEVTKAVYQNDKELQPLHEWLKEWSQQTMFNPDPPAPYHEGAVRFWKEKGIWTPDAEANQKKILGQ